MAEASFSSAHGKWWDTRLDWSKENYESMRQKIVTSRPDIEGAKYYKVLLVGATTVGKSSVINTMISALRNEWCQLAHSASDDKSVTKKYREFWLRESVSARAACLMLCDTMGFEQFDSVEGPSLQDVNYIMDGNITDGYEFHTNSKISFHDPHFRSEPAASDKVHVMMIVVDAARLAQMSTDVMVKLKELGRAAQEKNIHWGVLLTHIDTACADVSTDITTVFQSDTLRCIMDEVRMKLGATPANILPIQNYHSKVDVCLPINILALHALTSIIRLADNTLEAQATHFSADDPETQVIPLLSAPWRPSDAFDEEDVMRAAAWEDLLNISPPGTKLILLGPRGAGKSAFVNTAQSVFFNRIVNPAETGVRDHPVTDRYREYELREGRDGDAVPLVLCDTRGLTEDGSGLRRDDVRTVLTGRLHNKTLFQRNRDIDEAELSPLSSPAAVRVMAYMIDVTQIDSLSEADIAHYNAAADFARRESVPCAVLLTHIDVLCPHVNQSARHVFHSALTQQAVKKVSEKLQVPLVRVLPVCNFHNDTVLDDGKTLLLLHVLLQLHELAMDYMDQQQPPQQQPTSLMAKLKFW